MIFWIVDINRKFVLEEFGKCAVREVQHIAAAHLEDIFQKPSVAQSQFGHQHVSTCMRVGRFSGVKYRPC